MRAYIIIIITKKWKLHKDVNLSVTQIILGIQTRSKIFIDKFNNVKKILPKEIMIGYQAGIQIIQKFYI